MRQLINDIASRPSMWVANGSFSAAAAFISGYDWAIQAQTGLSRYETELGRFRTWLVNKLSEKREIQFNLRWEAYIILEEDESDKFALLVKWFNEYDLESNGSNGVDGVPVTVLDP